MKVDNRPIGIFDSGMGGLTVRAEIARALPCESLVYFGDGKNVPYGWKTQDEIISLVDSAVDRLLEKDIKMLVVACNAATGAAIDHLRAKYDIPIIGMEPAVKPAALSTETKVIGVLATAAAFRGTLYRNTAKSYRDTVHIVEVVGQGFVELVENDLEQTPKAYDTVQGLVVPMLEAGADRIVLGCTHYPFLTAQIERVIYDWRQENKTMRNYDPGAGSGESIRKELGKMGIKIPPGYFRPSKPQRDILIVDSAPAIARRTEQLLTRGGMHAEQGNAPRHKFLTAADESYRQHLIRKSDI